MLLDKWLLDKLAASEVRLTVPGRPAKTDYGPSPGFLTFSTSTTRNAVPYCMVRSTVLVGSVRYVARYGWHNSCT